MMWPLKLEIVGNEALKAGALGVKPLGAGLRAEIFLMF